MNGKDYVKVGEVFKCLWWWWWCTGTTKDGRI